jgi:hypothetical protein
MSAKSKPIIPRSIIPRSIRIAFIGQSYINIYGETNPADVVDSKVVRLNIDQHDATLKGGAPTTDFQQLVNIMTDFDALELDSGSNKEVLYSEILQPIVAKYMNSPLGTAITSLPFNDFADHIAGCIKLNSYIKYANMLKSQPFNQNVSIKLGATIAAIGEMDKVFDLIRDPGSSVNRVLSDAVVMVVLNKSITAPIAARITTKQAIHLLDYIFGSLARTRIVATMDTPTDRILTEWFMNAREFQLVHVSYTCAKLRTIHAKVISKWRLLDVLMHTVGGGSAAMIREYIGRAPTTAELEINEMLRVCIEYATAYGRD